MSRKTTYHYNVVEDDMSLQCLGKKTCPRISCGKRHVSATSRKTPCHWNVYRKTTCHCNVSKDEMPLQCLSEDDMPLQCLPNKSDGCLPLPHHVLSSAVAISAKFKNHIYTYESWFQNSCSNVFISIVMSFLLLYALNGSVFYLVFLNIIW